jgi:hypothetical protein
VILPGPKAHWRRCSISRSSIILGPRQGRPTHGGDPVLIKIELVLEASDATARQHFLRGMVRLALPSGFTFCSCVSRDSCY